METFLAIDFETAMGPRHTVCQIGIVLVENDVIKEEYSSLIRPPGNEYQKANIGVHGIKPEQTEDAPIFLIVWSKIKHLFQSQHLVAHQTSFDIDCLLKTLEFYDLEIPEFTSSCTYKMSDLKLTELCDALDIKLENHHNAANDAMACALAYIKMNNGVEIDHSKIRVFKEYEIISGDVLVQDLENADKTSPFYDKKVVVTGVFITYGRKEMSQMLKENGADINRTISKLTNYVVVGQKAGPVKLKNIESLNLAGADIQIINETEFLDMINLKS